LICIYSASGAEKPIELRLAGWTVIIEPETLVVRARVDGQSKEVLAAGRCRCTNRQIGTVVDGEVAFGHDFFQVRKLSPNRR
jgi:hypothetical protein